MNPKINKKGDIRYFFVIGLYTRFPFRLLVPTNIRSTAGAYNPSILIAVVGLGCDRVRTNWRSDPRNQKQRA